MTTSNTTKAVLNGSPRVRGGVAPARPLRVNGGDGELLARECLDIGQELEIWRRRYLELYDSAPVGNMTLDGRGRIRNLNLIASGLLRRDREELLGASFSQLLQARSRKKFRDHLRLCSTRGGTIGTELELDHQRGRPARFVELISRADRSPDRNGGSYQCVLLDITQRKHAEQALRESHEQLERRVEERTWKLTLANNSLQTEVAQHRQTELALRASEERFRLLVEGAHDYAIVMLDKDGCVATWNAGAARNYGYHREEIIGRHFSTFYPPEEQTKCKVERLLKAARAGRRAECEGWRVRKDGTRFWSSATISCLRDEKGRLRGYCKVARDVTEQRQAEEVLHRTQENLSSFFTQSPLTLFMISPKGHLTRVNQAGLSLLGRSERECKRLSIRSIIADQGVASQLLKQLARHQVVKNLRTRIRGNDNRIRHVLIDANGVWREGVMEHSRWFVRDITPRVELERKIMDVAERERERLGSDLHDDVCQQLAGIEFLGQTLAGQLREKSPSEAALASDIASMVRETIRHTRQLAHGLSPMPSGAVGLSDALGQLAEQTRRMFRVDCRFHCKSTNVGEVDGLGIHVYRVAQEAVTNAVKHGRARRIDIALKQRDWRLTLVVRDNGLGMPKKLREGKGMGLRALRYRAAVMGGSLTLKPNPRGGTVIVCTVGDPPRKLRLNRNEANL